jgi:hypothetical protein
MNTVSRHTRPYLGYSLGEMLAALVIAAMILTAVLGIYGRANQAADAVVKKVESPVLGTEVLQLIAEDLDRVLGSSGASIVIQNGFDNGFARAQMILRRTFHDAANQEQSLDEIVWRAGYDYESGIPGLVIYRSYSGVAPEDKLLDAKRKTWEENYPFVPICRGVTFFRIEVPNGDDFVDKWSAPALPPGVRISLSFAQPYETVRGTLDVSDSEKTSRTIAIDRTRAIKFTVPSGSGQGGESDNTNDVRVPQQPQR